MAKTILIEIKEEDGILGQEKVTITCSVPFDSLQKKYMNKEKMSLGEVSCHYMITRFMEFHQQRSAISINRKFLTKVQKN